MDITYTMIGADGSHYGPVTLEQLKGWVAEGRVTADTKILRSDTQSWFPATSYPELELSAPPPPLPTASLPQASTITTTTTTVTYDPILVRRIHSGARWFYWIAALSLINTFAKVGFVIGQLGIPYIISSAVLQAGGDNNTNVVIYVIMAGFFALFGFFAMKGQSWSFIVGGILYALDAVIFVMGQAWIIVVFHAFVLIWIFIGLKANLKLKALLR